MTDKKMPMINHQRLRFRYQTALSATLPYCWAVRWEELHLFLQVKLPSQKVPNTRPESDLLEVEVSHSSDETSNALSGRISAVQNSTDRI